MGSDADTTAARELVIDLRLSASAGSRRLGVRAVPLGELAALAARPRDLHELLRGAAYERVTVLRDARALSGVQAGGLLLASLARTRGFAVAGPSGAERFVPLALRARAPLSFAAAMSVELLLTCRALLRARRVTRRRAPARRRPRTPQRVAYLRAEPSLSWKGEKVGGVATHTSGIINGLGEHGLEVEVFAAEQPDGLAGAGTTVVAPRRVFQLVSWLTSFWYSRRLADAAASWRPDVAYQHHALGAVAGLELARRCGVPFVLGFHGSELWAEKNWGGRRVAFEGLAAALEERSLTEADLVVVVSLAIGDGLVEAGIDSRRILVNPSGVDVDRFAPVRAADPAAWRARLGRDDAQSVGFVGTFALFHGVALLPEMIAAVAAQRPGTRWVLIGDGPLHAQVVAEIEARGLSEVVDLPGVVPHEQAVELLASCEVCVSPHVPNPDGTRFFGSPTKLFEYMGLGRAIVASDLEQIGEVLDHERSALLCEPGDGAAAAASVLRLLDDPELAQRLGAAALADAQERYSWAAHTRRILDALAGMS